MGIFIRDPPSVIVPRPKVLEEKSRSKLPREMERPDGVSSKSSTLSAFWSSLSLCVWFESWRRSSRLPTSKLELSPLPVKPRVSCTGDGVSENVSSSNSPFWEVESSTEKSSSKLVSLENRWGRKEGRRGEVGRKVIGKEKE